MASRVQGEIKLFAVAIDLPVQGVMAATRSPQEYSLTMIFLQQLDEGLRPAMQARLALVVLCAAWLFGGATRFDVLAPAVPLLVGLGVLAILVVARGRRPLSLLEKLCWLGVFAVPLLQLVSLPPSLWTRLPVHDYPAEVLSAIGVAPWLPLTLTPSRTLSSALSFVPAFAAYLAARDLPVREANRLLAWLVGFAAVSVLLGLVQLSGGTGSKLRFYAITNDDAAVGFFSNANHFGTFIALCIPIAAYLGLRFEVPRALRDPRAVLVIAAGVIALLSAGTFASLSRAGIGAGALALLVSGAMILLHLRLPTRTKVVVGAFSIVLLAAAGGAFVASSRFASLAEIDQVGTEGRLALWPIYARMAGAAMPFGSGLGSFDPTFRGYEDYTKLGSHYLNNAHNDLAQVVIEMGVPGIVLLGLWAAQIATVFIRAWRAPERLDSSLALGRNKVVVLAFGIIVLLGHSLVDYPLRGACVSATFALLLAQLLGAGGPRPRSEKSHR